MLIESDGPLQALVNQGRLKLLAAESLGSNIAMEVLWEGIPVWI